MQCTYMPRHRAVALLHVAVVSAMSVYHHSIMMSHDFCLFASRINDSDDSVIGDCMHAMLHTICFNCFVHSSLFQRLVMTRCARTGHSESMIRRIFRPTHRRPGWIPRFCPPSPNGIVSSVSVRAAARFGTAAVDVGRAAAHRLGSIGVGLVVVGAAAVHLVNVGAEAVDVVELR